MREKVIKLYQFDELNERAQQKALESLWDLNVMDEWWFECITEEIKEFGKTSSLYCTYGGEFDCDRGSYISIVDFSTSVSSIVASADKVKGEYPNLYQEVIAPFIGSFTQKELRQIQRLEKACLLGNLYGNTSSHRKGQRAELDRYDHIDRSPRACRLINKVELAWEDLLRDLESTYLTMLRNEYEYQTSTEQIIESIRANEYEFLESGELA